MKRPIVVLKILQRIIVPLILVTAVTATVFPQQRVARGVTYYDRTIEDVPWALQVIEIDRDAPELEIGVALGGEYVLGIEPINRMINRVTSAESPVIAGINGDFYLLKQGPFQGDPVGFCVSDGELLSIPFKRSALVILDNGELVIDRFHLDSNLMRPDGSEIRLNGINQRCTDNGVVLLTTRFNSAARPQENAVLLLVEPLTEPLHSEGRYTFTVIEKHEGSIELAIPPNRTVVMGRGKGADFLGESATGDTLLCTLGISPAHGKIQHAVGGGPRLLRNGEISIEAEKEGISQSFVDTRHPRTAIGFNEKTVYFVTVDGRQEGYSAGMSLTELAEFMKEIGAKEAMNLDGGGSTTMWVDGEIKNKPSDGRIRPIANAVLLYRQPK